MKLVIGVAMLVPPLKVGLLVVEDSGRRAPAIVSVCVLCWEVGVESSATAHLDGTLSETKVKPFLQRWHLTRNGPSYFGRFLTCLMTFRENWAGLPRRTKWKRWFLVLERV